MAQCKRCGTEFSRFSLRGLKDICPACEKQMAPYREQAAAIPSREPETQVVTITLVVLNVAYFVLMVVNGVSPTEPDGLQILRWGSDYGPLVLGPEPWRLLTSMFIHIGIIHLAFNMWCLWSLGDMAEHLYGRAVFLTIYLGAGLCGSYLSLAWHPMRASAGASGAIFGIAGALIAAFKFGNLSIAQVIINRALRSVAFFAVANLVIGLGPQIDNLAHLGGLLGGFAIGFLFTRFFPPGYARYERAFLPIVGIVAVTLTLGYFGLRKVHADIATRGQAQVASERDSCERAVPLLEQTVTERPTDSEAHRVLAHCYEQLQRLDEKLRESRRAVEATPSDTHSWTRLGWLALDKNAAQSVEAFRSALRADAKSVEAHEGLGLALVESGHADEGLKEVQLAADARPDDPKVLRALVDAYEKLGRGTDTIKPLTRIAELEPNSPEAREDLADAYEALGDTKSAERERKAADALKAKQDGTPAR